MASERPTAKARRELADLEGKISESQMKQALALLDALDTGVGDETPPWETSSTELDDEDVLIELFLIKGRIGLYVARDPEASMLFWLDKTRKDDFGLPLTGIVHQEESLPETASSNVLAIARAIKGADPHETQAKP